MEEEKSKPEPIMKAIVAENAERYEDMAKVRVGKGSRAVPRTEW